MFAHLKHEGRERAKGFMQGASMYVVCVYALTCWFATQGWPVFTALGAMFCSIIPMGYIGKYKEQQSLGAVYSLRYGFWSFIIGDTVALPTALAACAVGWKITPWWFVATLLVGFIAGWQFHRFDAKLYANAGYGNLLDSPRKLYHDFGAYASLFGLVLAFGGPTVWYGLIAGIAELRVHALWFLGGLGLWLLMGLADHIREPRFSDSHIVYNWNHDRPY